MRRRFLPLLFAFGLIVPTAVAQTAGTNSANVTDIHTTTLFHTGDETGFPYRIPALAYAKNGSLVALSDRRPCGSDIGYGRVDIVGRVSSDNGATWGEPFNVLVGTGEGADAGYGDACLVADRTHNELLLVCVSGNVPYWKSSPDNRQRMVTLRARYDKRSKAWKWDGQPTDITSQIYDRLFSGVDVRGVFMGSGRICQSKRVKVGKYHRIYGALCTHKANFVIYSDDFGRNWSVLGSSSQPCSPGDEAKCEELPDGSVLISSRKDGGRFFNIFRYTDAEKGEGTWGQAVDSRGVGGGIANAGTPCNGEIIVVDAHRASDGAPTKLALQSIPAGPQRSNVTIYYKELSSPSTYATPRSFAADWEGSFQVSHCGSAYSTMLQTGNGRIAFFYEEEPQYYQMMFTSLGIDQITGGKYKL